MRDAVSAILVLGGLLHALAGSAEPLPSFEELGCLTPYRCYAYAYRVSADGEVVVGYSDRRAFRWQDGVMIELPAPGAYSEKWAFDASADGSVVVGRGGNEGFIWKDGQSTTVPGPLFSVSEDGAVMVGWFGTPRANPVRLEDGEAVFLGDLPGGTDTGVAYDLSADGRVIVGRIGSALGVEAFRWQDGVMSGLGADTDSGNYGAWVYISPDGSTIFGWANRPGGAYGWRWRDGELIVLDPLPGGTLVQPLGSNRNGDVLVGTGGTSEGSRAFIWDEAHGSRLLSDYLEHEHGLPTEGWTLVSAVDMTPDGRVIVGYGEDPDGNGPLSWRVELPRRRIDAEIDLPPFRENPHGPVNAPLRPGGFAVVALLGSDALDVGQVDRGSLAFGPAPATSAFPSFPLALDVNRDGWSDLVSVYRVADTGLEPGDTEACLSASTLDGSEIEACTRVQVVPAQAPR